MQQESVSAMKHTKLSYSVPELSKQTGICERKIWDEIKNGKLKTARFGKRVVISAREVDVWLENAAALPYEPLKTGMALRAIEE